MHITTCFLQKDWRALLSRGDRIPLEQSWGYGEAIARRYGVKRTRLLVHPFEGDAPVACVQVLQKTFAGQSLRGPVFVSPLSSEHKRDVMRAIGAQYPWYSKGIVFWLPDLPDSPDHRSLLWRSGFLRVQGGYQTAYVDLAKEPEALLGACRSTWRHDLEKSLLRDDVACVPVSQYKDLEWFLNTHEAFRQSTKIKMPSRGFLSDLYQCFLPYQESMTLLAHHQGSYHAGIMILSHGNTATYFAGVTTPQGRRLYAHHRLLWQAMDILREKGIRWLDLGGLNPKTMPGVTAFKRGLGGEEVRLCGTYIHIGW
jgi:hypothetical protein